MAFSLEEGVADLAELVRDEADFLDVDADGGVERWAEDGGLGACSDSGSRTIDSHALVISLP